MSVSDKFAAARERERQQRDADKTRMRCLDKAMRLAKLGVQVKMVGGWPDPALTEEDLDAMLAAEQGRRAALYEAFVRAGSVTKFLALAVQVMADGDEVYTIGNHDHRAKTNDSRLLGPLKRAEAKVTDGTSSFSWGKAMLMPVARAPLARKETADALVIFPDGTYITVALDGSRAVRAARKECMQFNVLASSSVQTPAPLQGDPAEKLQKLQELREAGLITQEEYEAKRAEIISSL